VSNNLNVLIPFLVASFRRVLRQSGFILNAVDIDASNAAGALGQTINNPFTAAVAGYTVTPGATPPALVDSTPTQNPLTLSQYKGARFHLTAEDWRAIGVAGPEFRSRMVDECFATLVHGISAYAFGLLDANAGRALGAQGTDPFASNPNAMVDGWKLLTDALAPDMDRVAALSTDEYAAASKLAQFQKLNEAPRGTDFAVGRLGMLSNFLTGYDQAVGTHTTGDATGYVTNGAVAVGDTTVTVDTGSGSWVAGDVFHFTGDTTRKYVVKSATATVITLHVPVTAAVADGVLLVKQASHRANFLVQRGAVALGIRPPGEAPDGDAADMVQVISDPVTRIAVRLAHYKGYHAGQWEASVLYGGAGMRPAHNVKLIA
jgi:hypothetical protein